MCGVKRVELVRRQHGSAEREEDLAVRAGMERHRAPDPVGRADHVARVDLREMVRAQDGRHREVDRLAALGGQGAQHRMRELDEVGVVDAALREAQQRRARANGAAGRIALHEVVSLECGDDAGGRALGQIGEPRELAQGRRAVLVQHEHEQLRGALDGLGTARASCLALTQHVGLMFPIVESSADLPVPSITHQTGGRMFVNKLPRYEILSPDAVETLERGWKRIVSELGVEFLLPEAVELFAKAGMRTEGDNVWLDPDFILEQVAKAPRNFEVQARNPAHNVHIGDDSMVFSSVYGPPFVRQGDVRRDATIDDYRNFVRSSRTRSPSST